MRKMNIPQVSPPKNGIGSFHNLTTIATYIAKNQTSPEKPSSTRHTSVFLPVSRANCPSVESQKLANIRNTTPHTFDTISSYWNIHPAPTPRNIDNMVMALGCTPNFSHINAKANPIGLVKCTSSHSSVSSDLNDAFNNSEKLLFISFL